MSAPRAVTPGRPGPGDSGGFSRIGYDHYRSRAPRPMLRTGAAKPLNCYPPGVHAYALTAERCVCGDTERPKRSP